VRLARRGRQTCPGAVTTRFGEMISVIARFQAWYYQFAFEQRAVDVPM
jgi:hypothetical protein